MKQLYHVMEDSTRGAPDTKKQNCIRWRNGGNMDKRKAANMRVKDSITCKGILLSKL